MREGTHVHTATSLPFRIFFYSKLYCRRRSFRKQFLGFILPLFSGLERTYGLNLARAIGTSQNNFSIFGLFRQNGTVSPSMHELNACISGQ